MIGEYQNMLGLRFARLTSPPFALRPGCFRPRPFTYSFELLLLRGFMRSSPDLFCFSVIGAFKLVHGDVLLHWTLQYLKFSVYSSIVTRTHPRATVNFVATDTLSRFACCSRSGGLCSDRGPTYTSRPRPAELPDAGGGAPQATATDVLCMVCPHQWRHI